MRLRLGKKKSSKMVPYGKMIHVTKVQLCQGIKNKCFNYVIKYKVLKTSQICNFQVLNFTYWFSPTGVSCNRLGQHSCLRCKVKTVASNYGFRLVLLSLQGWYQALFCIPLRVFVQYSYFCIHFWSLKADLWGTKGFYLCLPVNQPQASVVHPYARWGDLHFV